MELDEASAAQTTPTGRASLYAGPQLAAAAPYVTPGHRFCVARPCDPGPAGVFVCHVPGRRPSHETKRQAAAGKGYWKKDTGGLLVLVGAMVPSVESQDVQEEQQQGLREAQSLALRPCANPLCTDLSGCSEGRPHGRRCGGCQVARYCSRDCQAADCQRHARLAQQPIDDSQGAALSPLAL